MGSVPELGVGIPVHFACLQLDTARSKELIHRTEQKALSMEGIHNTQGGIYRFRENIVHQNDGTVLGWLPYYPMVYRP